MENYIPWYEPGVDIPVVKARLVNVDSVLADDIQKGREMPRIGIKQDVNCTTADGQLIQKGNYSVWNMRFYSEDAQSLSIKFEDTNFPENALMYLYNLETKFIVGPIKADNFKESAFKSDYIDGNHINITIFISGDEENIQINLSNYSFGIMKVIPQDEAYDNNFNNSEPCNVNVVCEANLLCQSQSVCKIIFDEGRGTGTLINNDCCDLRPLILSANHLIEDSEVLLKEFVFRFNYQSSECEQSVESNPKSWVSYTGTNVRANWEGTDFVLFELFDRLKGNHSFSGWDRTNNIGNTTRVIHHPAGDVKKITFDNDSPLIENDIGLDYPPNIVAGRYVRIEITNGQNGDFGILQPGSSGAPYFNNDNRIYAVHRGGDYSNCENTSSKWAGRINASWNGNGTNNTRLRNWLGSSTNPNTLDCMNHPFVEGPDLVCTSPETFTLISDMPCAKHVQWEASNSSLLNSPASGIGTTAILWGKPNVKGPVTITFTMNATGCTPVEIQKQFWVGEPNFDIFHKGPKQPCAGDVVSVFGTSIPDWLDLEITGWEVMGDCGEIMIIPSGIPNTVFVETFCEGELTVCAGAINECGGHRICSNITVRRCTGDENDGPPNPRSTIDNDSLNESVSIDVFPNPIKDEFFIGISSYDSETQANIEILSSNGQVISKYSSIGNTHRINSNAMTNGLYIIKCEVGGKFYYKKIIKQ